MDSPQIFKRTPCPDDQVYHASLRIDQSLTGVCLITIVALTYVNYRVIRIVGTKDIQLVLMLLFLKLSLLASAIFYGFSSSINKDFICDFSSYYYCMVAVFVPASAELLSIAVLINISKWIYFTLYIRALAEQDQPGKVEALQR